MCVLNFSHSETYARVLAFRNNNNQKLGKILVEVVDILKITIPINMQRIKAVISF